MSQALAFEMSRRRSEALSRLIPDPSHNKVGSACCSLVQEMIEAEVNTAKSGVICGMSCQGCAKGFSLLHPCQGASYNFTTKHLH